MRMPRFRIQTLMVVVATVAAGVTAFVILVARKADQANPEVVLWSNYWVQTHIQIEPFGWVVLAFTSLDSHGGETH